MIQHGRWIFISNYSKLDNLSYEAFLSFNLLKTISINIEYEYINNKQYQAMVKKDGIYKIDYSTFVFQRQNIELRINDTLIAYGGTSGGPDGRLLDKISFVGFIKSSDSIVFKTDDIFRAQDTNITIFKIN